MGGFSVDGPGAPGQSSVRCKPMNNEPNNTANSGQIVTSESYFLAVFPEKHREFSPLGDFSEKYFCIFTRIKSAGVQ